MFEFTITTNSRVEFINIDHQVQKAVADSGVTDGVCYIFVPHTTAAVTINEKADPNVVRDIIAQLDKVIPLDDNYRHLEGNSAAHIKASLIGPSEIVLVQNGRLALGTWQSIFFCEFDGPRRRRVLVKVI
ncbi:MAG: secondary thiamine-phosphate synthase enzyme YjbQ [candidate division KSB1 bacterium]|nr:secondary thiamine-phosphate synthase enzyme YjbQ [candidate division KSB1 bacterium]